MSQVETLSIPVAVKSVHPGGRFSSAESDCMTCSQPTASMVNLPAETGRLMRESACRARSPCRTSTPILSDPLRRVISLGVPPTSTLPSARPGETPKRQPLVIVPLIVSETVRPLPCSSSQSRRRRLSLLGTGLGLPRLFSTKVIVWPLLIR